MKQDQWDAETTRQIQQLMEPDLGDNYVTTLASYLGADPALLRAMVHCQHLELSGNTLADIRTCDEALKQFEQQTAVQSQQTKTY